MPLADLALSYQPQLPITQYREHWRTMPYCRSDFEYSMRRSRVGYRDNQIDDTGVHGPLLSNPRSEPTPAMGLRVKKSLRVEKAPLKVRSIGGFGFGVVARSYI